ncbi:uncharacterized protein N7477_004903 [Penicillium maclennaniae]|uniref:uncharacterized protein n=1 Tax=Penicillium maclennaniae TaxID=1343394 RepID=UPI00253FDFE8|nr:uncharacterized protein N7477_004903 [Penicillium maclennaniae]KAJ5674969.1 hypothetical protein N7477_004903 [Penicillium maclennaniae]
MSHENERHHIVAIEALHYQIPDFDIPVEYTKAIHRWTEPSELVERIKDATIVITTTIRLPSEALDVAVTPKLRLIVIMATGTDCVDLAAAKARGIPVCNCPGSNVDSVSEHAIGLYFATRRKLVTLHNATIAVPESLDRNTEWKMNGSLRPKMSRSDGLGPFLCSDETVAIIGYGMLGKRIEALAKALGMKVKIAERKGVAPRGDRIAFEDALKESTVLFFVLATKPRNNQLDLDGRVTENVASRFVDQCCKRRNCR